MDGWRQRSGGIKGIFRIRSVSKAQAISILCCSLRSLRLDLLSLGCWVHGLYQGGLEPSWDGTPHSGGSVWVPVAQAGMFTTMCTPGVPGVRLWCARTGAPDPWTLALTPRWATLHLKPHLKAVDAPWSCPVVLCSHLRPCARTWGRTRDGH